MILLFFIIGIIGLIFYLTKYTENFITTTQEESLTTSQEDSITTPIISTSSHNQKSVKDYRSNRSKCFTCDNYYAEKAHPHKCFACENQKNKNFYRNKFLQR
jgi:hypothetical protein